MKKRKPRTTGPGLSVFAWRCCLSEAEVHAAAHDVRRERYVVRIEAAAAAETAIEVTEIDIEILGLCRPGAGDHEFKSAAGRPACIGDIAAGKSRAACLDVADRETAGDVRQEAIE